MNPDEDARLSWLADVRATLAEAVERDLAVLGICLGAQLLGQALGVGAPRLEQPELGWFTVELTDAGADDVLLGPLGARLRGLPVARLRLRAAAGRGAARALASARPSRPTASGTRSGRCSSTSRSMPYSSSAGRAPSRRSCARAAPTPPRSSPAHAPTSRVRGLSHALMGRFLTVARSRAGRPVA